MRSTREPHRASELKDISNRATPFSSQRTPRQIVGDFASRLSLSRIIGSALTLVLHGVLVVLLTLPLWHELENGVAPTSSPLKVRFIETFKEVEPIVAARPLSAPKQSSRLARVKPYTEVSSKAQILATKQTTQPLDNIARSSVTLDESDYIEGGGLLTGKVSNRRTAHLPGAPALNSPQFRMVDPRTQGVAGVVRIIGSFTGAVEPKCVDLDVWRAMTPDERIANHVSMEDIEAVQNDYNCVPPKVKR